MDQTPSTHSPGQRETDVIWAVTKEQTMLGFCTACSPTPASHLGPLEEDVNALRGVRPYPASMAAGRPWKPDIWVSLRSTKSFPHLEMLHLSPLESP